MFGAIFKLLKEPAVSVFVIVLVMVSILLRESRYIDNKKSQLRSQTKELTKVQEKLSWLSTALPRGTKVHYAGLMVTNSSIKKPDETKLNTARAIAAPVLLVDSADAPFHLFEIEDISGVQQLKRRFSGEIIREGYFVLVENKWRD